MDIKKGDRVKFLNEAGGGIVVRLIDNKQALVQIEDGFEIPMLISNLVKTDAVGERNTAADKNVSVPQRKLPEKKEVPVQAPEKQALKVKESARPLFALVPISQKANTEARFELHLLNDGDFHLYYMVALEKAEWLMLHEKGELEPEMKVSLGTFTLQELVRVNNIVIDFLVYKEEDYKYQAPINSKINIKSLNLQRESSFRENDFFYENACIVDCTPFETLVNKAEIIVPKENQEIKPAKAPEKNSDIEEIDLHIEEIVEDMTGLEAGEILKIQMARFTTALEGAIKSKTKKIVFIHGVGNGKLKFELRRTLENQYAHLKYQDASYAEYGFGATMVILK